MNNIKELKTFYDLSRYLNIKTGHLARIINDKNRYKSFSIRKKSKSDRIIQAPNKELLFIQKKLLLLLEKSCNPHKRSFAFEKNKNIIKNAEIHVGKNYVLNIDLADYFPSISFGRVRSLFINYFGMDQEISTSLTNICVHPDGYLPQGAPTSPIISNILSKTMDKDFVRICRMSNVNYTRYADDITLSSNVEFNNSFIFEEKGILKIGSKVEDIITRNGFNVNHSKTRLRGSNQKQVVTGLKVNQKVNVDRDYIRVIRAILKNLLKYKDDPIEIQKIIEKYNDSFYKKQTKNIEGIFLFLKGRLLFLSQVRGEDDRSFLKYAREFNYLISVYKPNNIGRIKINSKDNIFVIDNKKVSYYCGESGELDSVTYGQGTAFYLNGYGLITNYHVLEHIIEAFENNKIIDKNLNNIEFFSGQLSEYKLNAKIKKYSKQYDIVVLDILDESDVTICGFEKEINHSRGQKIKVLGYPGYMKGNDLNTVGGEISSTRKDHFFQVDALIQSGNSGGPVLNRENKVLGIATQGTGKSTNLAVKIDYLDKEIFTYLD